MSEKIESGVVGTGIKRTFHRTIIKACQNCGAPGRYSSVPAIAATWPNCAVDPSDPRDGQNIVDGDCPHCGHPRPAPIELPVMEFTD